jgi:hypothetical protein
MSVPKARNLKSILRTKQKYKEDEDYAHVPDEVLQTLATYIECYDIDEWDLAMLEEIAQRSCTIHMFKENVLKSHVFK